ncbi:LpqB family beta-propeller domain-containing protein [Salinifilum ghardaiensis]
MTRRAQPRRSAAAGARTGLRALAAALVLAVSGCATIPEHSEPRGVRWMEEGNTSGHVQKPREGADPLQLVRSFVGSAAPENEHEAARLHLAPQARADWSPSAGMLIVDQVDTVPVPNERPLPEGVQLVGLRAEKVGRLLPDRSFTPEQGEFRTRMRVERQDDGQWRIATPPPELVVTRDSFGATYRSVSVYFLDSEGTGVVPDVRYVPSQPASTLPRRVVDLLMMGPSESMRPALRTGLPKGVRPKTNASESADGALEVNFSDLGGVPPETRRLIAAQVVYSLQSVSSARVRLKEEGTPLLPDRPELRPADVRSYVQERSDAVNQPGLAVVDESLVHLDEQAKPVAGPAGNGEYDVVRAGVSPDGSRLAAVTRRPGGVVLRAGGEGSAQGGSQLSELHVAGAFMSKPEWRGSGEVWTSVDGRRVVRAVATDSGWDLGRVDVSALGEDPKISDLRLSPGGARAALVSDGELVVAAVAEVDGRMTLSRPTRLPAPGGTRIRDVEWRSNDGLVATTDSNRSPVYNVSVDGLYWTPYTASNLGQPVNAVTVAPGGRVIVADRSGLWESQDSDDVWGLMPVPIGGASIPFYPG